MVKDVKDILEKYSEKIGGEIGSVENFSREYKRFKEEQENKELSFYEKACNFCENILKVKVSDKKRNELLGHIDRLDLGISPEGANSFAFFVGIVLILIGVLIFVISLILGEFLLFFPFLFIVLGLVSIKLLVGKLSRMALKLRLKAENQMVLCILYVIMYMRHTSNLEHAVKFAAIHIDDPLSRDLKLVFWNLETGKYNTLKESLDVYLESWKEYHIDFVNSFHLIESSLYEGSEDRRLDILEKALKSMLDGAYERMLHYAQELKNPVTTLYMLGVILPILGLIVLPLMGGFFGIKWYWLGFFYNLILPIFVYYYGSSLLIKRPAGESESGIVGKEFEKYEYVSVGGIKLKPGLIVIPFLILILIIGLCPVFLKGIISEDNLLNDDLYFGYRNVDGKILGPYGVGALLLSFIIPLGLGIGLGTYYVLKTRKLMNIRKSSKDLEKEFSGSLFQLGNRIEDGLPVEVAFGKVAENMEGTTTGEFFRIVSVNLRRLGMGVKQAIFNKKVGALRYYPSKIIKSSMEVLIESASKGPKVAAHSLISISNYMSSIHNVNERLKDLLTDVLSSIKGQINFLTPLIVGIVVGISTMITNIIVNLGPILGATGEGNEAILGLDLSLISQIFPVDKVMPSFYFQLVVGVYLIEIIFILTMLSNSIEHGVDKLSRENSLGKNLYKGVVFYVIVAVVVTLILSFMARGIMNVSAGGGL